MKIIRAEAMGMCFGVRDALAAARSIERPADVTIRGELVHNGEVLRELTGRGISMQPESERDTLPSSPAVLITAHGTSDRDRARMESAGKAVIDTTCPLVRFAHRSALLLAQEGRFVLVAGRRTHVEVLGLVGDLDRFEVIESPEEVRTYEQERLGLVFQTTTHPQDAARIRRAVLDLNPAADLRVIDTVCAPTKERQSALDELLGRVEALVVVGGRHSNNTKQLVKTAQGKGIPAIQVESSFDLDASWLRQFRVVGLSAGTSTLDSTIDAVERTMKRIGMQSGETRVRLFAVPNSR